MIKSKTILINFNDYYELLHLLRVKEYYSHCYQVLDISIVCARGGVGKDIVTITYKDKENE